MANLVGQPAPDGAYVIGGNTASGNPYQFGQGMTEDLANSVINPAGALFAAMGSVGDALAFLEKILLTLPLEALKLFAPVIGVGVEVFSTVGGAVAAIMGSVIVRPLVATIEQVLELIAKLLAPLGHILEAGASLEDALNKLVLATSAPWQMLSNMQDYLEDVMNEMNGLLASQQHQISTLELQLDDADPRTGFSDNCATLTHVEDIVGAVVKTGWGAWKSDFAVWLDDREPTTDRHGIGFLVKAKRIGRTILWITSNDDATGGCGLLLDSLAGTDQVSVVTRTGPDTYVVRQTIQFEVPTNSFWQFYYGGNDDTVSGFNTFYVFMNRTYISDLTWTDEGNVVPHPEDGSYRRVGGTMDEGFSVSKVVCDDWTEEAPQ